MVNSEFAEEEMLMSGKTSCNEEEDEDMGNEWSQNPNSVSTEERSPLRAASDNSSTGSTGNDGDMLTLSGVNSSSSTAIDGGLSNRNGSVTPLDDRRLRRQIANCNERRRMQSINAGFQALRSLLPRKDGEKMSKAAILQHTADYILALQEEKNRLMDENNAIVQCKKRRIGSEYPESMDSSESSIPVIKSQPIPPPTPGASAAEVMEYLRTIDDLKLALSKEHRLRVIYEREVIEMKTKSIQEANTSLGVLRAAAGVQSLLSSQPLSFDPALHRSDSSSLLMAHPQASHMPPPSTPADSLLLAASQQVYNNVLLNAAAAAATTPPALAGVTSAQLSPHHAANVATNPSSPYHPSQIRSTIGDLVVSTSGGISPTACIMETPVSLSGNPHHLAAGGAATSAATFAAISSKMVSSAPVVANGLPRSSTQLTQRNLQAIIEAIRHIEGGNMVSRVAATSSPSPHSTDLLVR